MARKRNKSQPPQQPSKQLDLNKEVMIANALDASYEEIEKKLINLNKLKTTASAVDQKSFQINTGNIKEIKKETNELEEHVKFLKEKLKLLIEIGEMGEKEAERVKEVIEASEKILEKSKEHLEHYDKMLKLSKELAGETTKFLTSLTGIGTSSNNIISSMMQIAKQGMGIKDIYSSIKSGVKEFFGAKDLTATTNYGKALESLGNFSINIFTSMLNKAISVNLEFIKQMEEAEKQVFKLTGAQDDAQDVLYDSWNATNRYGMQIQETAASMVSLSANVNKFNQMSVQSRIELTNTISILGRLGISVGVSSTAYNSLVKGLGATQEFGDKAIRKLADLGAMLGDNSKAINEFDNALKILSGYGAEAALKSFTELAKQSFATGVEISSLLSIASKFDTFEDAATAAGKLNAILGGPLLNSTDLLLASEDERIDILIRSVNQSGRAWDSLNKFDQKAIMTAAGIKDLTEANKLFGQSYEEYQNGLIQAEKVAESQKSAEAHAEKAQTVMERLTTAMQLFIIKLDSVVGAIEGAINWLIKADDTMGGYLIPTIMILVGTLGILKLILAASSSVMSIFSASATATTPAIKGAARGMRSLGRGLKNLGNAGVGATKGILILAAVTGIFLGLAYAASILIDAIIRLTPSLVTIFRAFGDNFWAVIKMSGALIILGSALSIIGGLSPLIIVGVGALVVMGFAIKSFLDIIISGDKETKGFIANLANLATNGEKLVNIPGYMRAIGEGFTAMMEGISFLDMISFSLFTDKFISQLSRCTAAIDAVSNAYKKLSINQTQFKGNFDSVVQLTQQVNNLSGEKVSYFESIAKSTIQIINSSKDSGDSAGIISAIKELIGVVNNQTAKMTPPTTTTTSPANPSMFEKVFPQDG